MPHFQSHSFRAMGSPCCLHLYADSEQHAQQAAQAVEAEVLRLEQKYSRYRDDSLTAAINQAAKDGASIEVDNETAALLDYAHTAWLQSDGLFDITSGLLRRVWNFRSGKIPTQKEIDLLLPHIGWGKVGWHNPLLNFVHRGMELDFGGYVKEYGADCAAAVAQQQGIQHGLIELGGDIRVIGPHPDGRPWSVGIRHPRTSGQVLAQIALTNGAIASSGDYERCIELNGKRYGHILDPRSGWPVQGLISVSVVANHCLLAGSATTIALLRGDQGTDWLDSLDLPWLAMDQQGNLYGTLQDSVSSADA
ncbi:MAG TPA: FAD:protein FMN transferase [Dongiaceae bacterium]|nr:FAD:protein FMN transferase [Dongiaceae bacterium]